MIHYIGIVLVVWGLVTQPLMANTMPMTMDDKESNTVMMSGLARSDRVVTAVTVLSQNNLHEYGENGVGRIEKKLKMPCHQTTANHSSAHCCASDCVSGCSNSQLCSSSCINASASAVVLQTHSTQIAGFNPVIFFSTNFQTLISGLPSRIFHPPRQR